MTLTLAVSGAAGIVAHRWKVPGGAILAALIAAAALHLAVTDLRPLPGAVRLTAQILIGTVIGASLSRSPLRALRRIAIPMSVFVAALVTIAVACGFAFAWVSGLPLLTSLFSTAPGGASDMTAAALQYDTDAALIAGFHLVRQLAIFVFVAGAFTRLLQPPPDEPD